MKLVENPSLTSAKKYSPELDFIKAVAIFLVMAFHYFPGQIGWHLRVFTTEWFFNYWQKVDLTKIIHFIDSYFYVGVNLFVIASGFGLYFSELKNGQSLSLKNFFQKRLWRLMPSAIFSLIILFLVKGLLLDHWPVEKFYLNFFPFLAGLNLFSDQWFFAPINGETWFLGLIIQLYLFYPLLGKLLSKLGQKYFLLLLFLISVLFRIIYYVYFKDSISSLSYGLSLSRIFEFGFGMVLAEKVFKGEKLSNWWSLGILAGLGYFFSWTFPFADSLLGIGVFTLLWSLGQNIKPRQIWTSLSAQSYLMFLLHHPFIWVLNKWGFNQQWNFIGILVFLLFFIAMYFLAKASSWILNLPLRYKKIFD